VVVQEMARPDGGDDRKMLGFETLTWVPIDRHLIVTDLLSQDELLWINTYHNSVFEKVSPRLEGADLAWLRAACAPI
jgi:Xaa-Pro aminopeptidase